MTHFEDGLARKGDAWNESTAENDPVTGRWIAFNAAHGGRADVYAVEVD